MATLLLSAGECGKKETTVTYKGRLEVTGICMNYTISVIEGDIDASLVEQEWKDETTGISYQDVFRLGSPCTFPNTLKKGDEFYFVIDTARKKDCAVCMAYYPVPAKSLEIRVVEK